MTSIFYYGVNDPGDDLSAEIIENNRSELRFWQLRLPDDEDDLATTILKLNIRTGIPRKYIASSLFTVRFLPKLPSLSALIEELNHLDMARLNTITRALSKVPSTLLELFDEHVTSYLTPRMQHQVLPQPGSIAATLRRLRDKLIPEDDPPTKQHTGVCFARHDSLVRISVSVTADRAAVFNEAINRIVKEQKITPAEAFTGLITGNIQTGVTMNVYGTRDEPEFLAGGDWFTDSQIQYWKTKITASRDIEAIAFEETSDYSPTKEMKLYVRGRDLTCRVPGCTVSASNCQIDHIIPFADGGPTTPWNLQCLCIFHHNMKTDGRLEAAPLPNGEVLFILDGLPFRSSGEGPLSRSNKTWGTRFGDYMDRKIAA